MSDGHVGIRVAVPAQNLGTIAREKKQYARALELLYRAEAIRDYPNALALYRRALAVLEVAAGPYHSVTIDALSSLARRSAGDGDLAKAFEYQARIDGVLEKNTELNLAVGSERDKLAYFQSIAERFSNTISLQLRDPTNGAQRPAVTRRPASYARWATPVPAWR